MPITWKSPGGNGTLLGGVPGVEPARVVVLGGVVGTQAAKMAAGLVPRSLSSTAPYPDCNSWMTSFRAGLPVSTPPRTRLSNTFSG